MLAIVSGHFCRKTDILSSTPLNLAGLPTFCLGSGLCVAVNVFIFLAMWFLVSAKFSAKRILLLYLQVFFFVAPISTILFVCGLFTDPRALICSFLPVFGVPVWFATDFIIFLLLVPFFSQAFLLDKQSLRLLLSILFSIFCLGPTIFKNFNDPTFLGGIMWFTTVYIFVGMMKRENWIARINHVSTFLFAAGILYILLCLWHTLGSSEYPEYYLTTINTLPNFLCAFFIFAFSAQKKSFHSPVINKLATATFAVYVFHEAPAVRPVQWKICLYGIDFLMSKGFHPCLGVLGISCIIFIFYSLLGLSYKRFIEPSLIHSRGFRAIETRLQELYRGIGQHSVCEPINDRTSNNK